MTFTPRRPQGRRPLLLSLLLAISLALGWAGLAGTSATAAPGDPAPTASAPVVEPPAGATPTDQALVAEPSDSAASSDPTASDADPSPGFGVFDINVLLRLIEQIVSMLRNLLANLAAWLPSTPATTAPEPSTAAPTTTPAPTPLESPTPPTTPLATSSEEPSQAAPTPTAPPETSPAASDEPSGGVTGPWSSAPPSPVPGSTGPWSSAPPSPVPGSTGPWSSAPPSPVPGSTGPWSSAPPSPVPGSTGPWSSVPPWQGDDCGASVWDACQWYLAPTGDTWGSWRLETSADEDWIGFTVPVTGIWSFASNGLPQGADVLGRLYDANGNLVAWDDDSNGAWNFRLTTWLQSGWTYYLGVRNYSPQAYVTADPYYIVATAPPSRQDCQEWPLDASGSRVSGGLAGPDAQQCWSVIAPVSGWWTLASSDLPEGTDVAAELLSNDGYLITSGDDSAGSLNFALSAYLEAGTRYILKVHNSYPQTYAPAWTYTVSASLDASVLGVKTAVSPDPTAQDLRPGESYTVDFLLTDQAGNPRPNEPFAFVMAYNADGSLGRGPIIDGRPVVAEDGTLAHAAARSDWGTDATYMSFPNGSSVVTFAYAQSITGADGHAAVQVSCPSELDCALVEVGGWIMTQGADGSLLGHGGEWWDLFFTETPTPPALMQICPDHSLPPAWAVGPDPLTTGWGATQLGLCQEFTVETSGRWTLTSSDSGGIDLVATLYDGQGNWIGFDDDSAGYPNFALTADLVAGQTYYLQVRGINLDAPVQFRLSASRDSTVVGLSTAVSPDPLATRLPFGDSYTVDLALFDQDGNPLPDQPFVIALTFDGDGSMGRGATVSGRPIVAEDSDLARAAAADRWGNDGTPYLVWSDGWTHTESTALSAAVTGADGHATIEVSCPSQADCTYVRIDGSMTPRADGSFQYQNGSYTLLGFGDSSYPPAPIAACQGHSLPAVWPATPDSPLAVSGDSPYGLCQEITVPTSGLWILTTSDSTSTNPWTNLVAALYDDQGNALAVDSSYPDFTVVAYLATGSRYFLEVRDLRGPFPIAFTLAARPAPVPVIEPVDSANG